MFHTKILSRFAPTAFPFSPFSGRASFQGKWEDYLSYEREMRGRNQFWCVPYIRSSDPSTLLLSISYLVINVLITKV